METIVFYVHCDSIQHGGFREDSASVRSRARHQPPHCSGITARECLSRPRQEEVEDPPDFLYLCPRFCGGPQQSTDLHLQHSQHLTGGQPPGPTQNIVGSTSQKKIINQKLQLLVYRVIFAPYYFHRIGVDLWKDFSQFAILQLLYYNKCNCILQLAWI